jgi:hypothetical protein
MSKKWPDRGFFARTGFITVGTVSMVALATCAASPSAATPPRAKRTATAAAKPDAGNVFGRAIEITPPPLLSTNGQDDGLISVSCPGPRECTASGGYLDTSLNGWPMVTSQAGGGWASLSALPLPDNSATTQLPEVTTAISCTSPAACVAVGAYDYAGGGGDRDAYIAEEWGGTWVGAFAPTLPANAAGARQASLSSVSCVSTGNCVAAGSYADKFGNTQIMVVTETAGSWGRAREIAAPRFAAKPISAGASGISCYRRGTCVAVGGYVSASGTGLPLTFTRSNGTWHRATKIGLPRNALTGKNNGAGLSSVRCAATGFCIAVGSYNTKSIGAMMALAGSKGLSGRASQVTASPLAAGRHPFIADLNSVSCVSASRCVAVGSYEPKRGGSFQAMSMIWSKGRWGNARKILLPSGADTSSNQIAGLSGVACVRTGYCAAVGGYVYLPDVNLNSAAMVTIGFTRP